MMDRRPVYVRGRGRGRGLGDTGGVPGRGIGRGAGRGGRGHTSNVQEDKKVGNPNLPNKVSSSPPGSPEKEAQGAESRFQEASARHLQAAQQHLDAAANEPYDSSSEEDELQDDAILQKVLKSFKSCSGEDDNASSLGRTQEYIHTSMQSKASACLICIETIRRVDPIWCCTGCYTAFHIVCVQKWVKDGVYQNTAFSDDNTHNKDIPWNCPKCRHEFTQKQCPTRYYCFCGKSEDPQFDPWLVPHSCGQTCQRPLVPSCGHECLLLCHPGPCPPCPQTVRVSCHCGKQSPQIRRCGAQTWSCGQQCSHPLGCGHHSCKHPCHPGECPPCPETSVQPCQCGRQSVMRPCASPKWQCVEVCGHPLSCGHHTCELVCHPGDCGSCPRAGKRKCSCGKSEFELPCTEDVPTCMDTCSKLLPCGLHPCTQLCHYGACGTCREMVKKTCRCGKKHKDVQCYKDYQCELKCTKMRDCRKHQCKKKCCDGECPLCDQPCGKSLPCHNHKCSSRCHPGPCYPCTLAVTLSCPCGGSVLTVPCGREKVTRPPRCSLLCKKPPDCHHVQRTKHRCHAGDCPPCRELCGRPLGLCNHTCPAPCHSAVRKVWQKKREGPWEAPTVHIELVDLPCPDCMVPVPVSCQGNHETVMMPCHAAKVASCHRPCGRQLSCGNHACQLDCHLVEGAPDEQKAGQTCAQCEERCQRSRPEGCKHRCLLMCHPEDCPPCTQHIRMRCHCRLTVKHIECDEWSHADDTERQRLQSCRSKCPRTMPCGHQCKTDCHPGSCPAPERCTEKVKLRCPCRRKKRDWLCNEQQAGLASVECDEVCHTQKEKSDKEKAVAEQQRVEVEELARQKELEDFERRIGGRRKKQRKQRVEVVQASFLQKYAMFIIAPMLILVLAVFCYWLLSTN